MHARCITSLVHTSLSMLLFFPLFSFSLILLHQEICIWSFFVLYHFQTPVLHVYWFRLILIKFWIHSLRPIMRREAHIIDTLVCLYSLDMLLVGDQIYIQYFTFLQEVSFFYFTRAIFLHRTTWVTSSSHGFLNELIWTCCFFPWLRLLESC